MNVQSKIDFDRQDELKELAAEVDAVAESARDYATGNEDYAEPLFYSDWEIDLRNLDDEIRALVDEYKTLAGRKDWENEIKGFCDVVACGIYREANEICSFAVGELEEQLPDELADKLAALAPDEYEYVCRATREGFLPSDSRGYVYVNCDYDRWVLVLDGERLAEEIDRLKADA
jgi:hypothetical protein